MQERLFFRNIPLSNWIEHEMIIEEDRDLEQLPKESVFSSGTIAGDRLPVSKFLDEIDVREELRSELRPDPGALVSARIPAFGAQ